MIAGSDEVFAAGADIKAMRERSFQEALDHPTTAFWNRLAAVPHADDRRGVRVRRSAAAASWPCSAT